MKKLNLYPSLYILLEDMKSATASYKPSLFKIVLQKLFCTRWAPNGARRSPRPLIIYTWNCLSHKVSKSVGWSDDNFSLQINSKVQVCSIII